MDSTQLVKDMAAAAMATNWVAGACITCLLYDHVLTLPEEISGMWYSRWSLPKALFFFNRYLVEAMIVFNGIASHSTNLSVPFCVWYMRWLVVTTSFATIIVEGILMVRVWALFRHNKLVLAFALFAYFACSCTLIGLTITDYVVEKVAIVSDFSFLPGCYASGVPSMIAGYWIAPALVESIFFVLVISRAVTWLNDRSSAPRTLMLLSRDSAVYFAIIFVILMANLFVFEFGPPSYSAMLVTPSNTTGCIAGSRLLLNLRGLRERTVIDGIEMEEAHTQRRVGI